MNDMKPIQGYPGYYVTRDGQVFSSRNSWDGSLKARKTRADGTVLLINPINRKYYKVAQLVADAWGADG